MINPRGVLIVSFLALIFTTQTGDSAIKDVLQSVCVITVADKTGVEMGQGSAVVVSSGGQAVTCFHVLSGAHSARVKFSDGTEYEVSGFTYADPDTDFAIIQIKGDAPFEPITLGNLEDVDIGDEVYSIGNPKGWEGTVAQGIVSAIRVTPEFGKIIQTTAPISPGSSGGALVDKKGRLIGITKFIWRDSQNLNFATPIDIISPHFASRGVKQLASLPDAPIESIGSIGVDVLFNLMAEGGWQADFAEFLAGSLGDLREAPSKFPMYLVLLAKNNRMEEAQQAYRAAITNATLVNDDVLAARAYIILRQAELEKALNRERAATRLYERAGEDAFAVLKRNNKHAFACSIYLDAHFGAQAYKALDQNSAAAIRNFPQYLFPWRNRLWALVFLDRYDEAISLSNTVLSRNDVDKGVIYYWRGLFTKWKLTDYGYRDTYGRRLASEAIGEFQRAIANGNPDGYSGIREVKDLGF